MQNIFKPKTHATIKDALLYKLKTVVLYVGVAMLAFVAVHWLTGGVQNMTMQPHEDHSVVKPLSPGSPEYVFNQHKADCWNGTMEKKADFPGAAIIQWSNGMVQYTTVHWKVSAAFDEVLASIGYGDKTTKKFDVIALCK